jgi:uncharacterized membrane protein
VPDDFGAVVDTATVRLRRRMSLVVVFVTALALRGYRLGAQSLWVDEIYAVAVRGSAPVGELLTAIDPHPPLYYLLLHGWMSVFGKSAVAARSLSVLFGMVGVLALYLLGRRLYDDRVGLLAAGLLAVSPMHVQYSRETRMYALLVALVVVATWLYVRLLDDDRWILEAGYLLAALAALYTHLFATFVLAAHGGHALWVWYREGTARSGAAVGLQLLAGLGFLPWIAVLARESVARGTTTGLVDWIAEPTPRILSKTMQAFAGRPVTYPYALDDPTTRASSTVAVTVVLVLAWAFAFHDDRQRRWPRAQRRRDRGLLVGLLVVPIAGPYLLSVFVEPVYVIRYTLPALPAFVLIAAAGVAVLDHRPLRYGLVAVLVVTALVSVGAYHDAKTAEEWRPATEYVSDRVEATDAVVATPDWTTTAAGYYLENRQVRTVEGVLDVPAPPDRVWLVVRNPADDPTGRLDEYHTVDRREFGTLSVVLLERS